jgi:hypothetical protein
LKDTSRVGRNGRVRGENLRGNSYLYIFIDSHATLHTGSLIHLRGPTPERPSLPVHSCSMMRWRLDNQDGFADSLCSNLGKQDIDVALIAFGSCILLEQEFIAYRLCSSPKMERLRGGTPSILKISIRLRQCCETSRLVCRMLISEVAIRHVI